MGRASISTNDVSSIRFVWTPRYRLGGSGTRLCTTLRVAHSSCPEPQPSPGWVKHPFFSERPRDAAITIELAKASIRGEAWTPGLHGVVLWCVNNVRKQAEVRGTRCVQPEGLCTAESPNRPAKRAAKAALPPALRPVLLQTTRLPMPMPAADADSRMRVLGVARPRPDAQVAVRRPGLAGDRR
jgi:hypothetical protein